VWPFIDTCYADQGINCRFALVQVLASTSSFQSTKVKEKKGVFFQRHFLCRSGNKLQICIGASVGIDILILKYKGEGEEGCGLS
jgi:hypothetical protein